MAPIRASPRTYSTANDIRCYTNSFVGIWGNFYGAASYVDPDRRTAVLAAVVRDGRLHDTEV